LKKDSNLTKRLKEHEDELAGRSPGRTTSRKRALYRKTALSRE